MTNSFSSLLFTAQQVQQGERQAAQLAGVEMYQLMLNAGRSAYQILRSNYPRAKHLLILCGSGNNGGDGFVVAKLAQQDGLAVTLALYGQPEQLTGDALTAKNEWQNLGGEIQQVTDLDWPKIKCDVIVDALLGTGLSGQMTEPLYSVIKQVNHLQLPVVAIDIPSGLCSNTGQVLGMAVVAAHTVTFIGIKQGMVTGQARAYTGKLHFADLDVRSQFEQCVTPSAKLIDVYEWLPALPRRIATAHKGHHGRLLCLGGNQGYAGAISLCSSAAMRSGVGLVKTLCHSSSVLAIQVRIPEVMVQAWSQQDKALEQSLNWADVIALGPGLGQDAWAQQLFQMSAQIEKPKVIDADGLNLLAQQPNHDHLRVITPHPGEAARLLGCTVNEIEADRYTAVRSLQAQYGGVAVLKGAGTLICDGEMTYVCPAGNPGMATGGMGDVLTGMIAALLAQGMTLCAAATVGVHLHSVAADQLANEQGAVGLLASDLLPRARTVLNQWLNQE
ncbi:NAD(P)H-hydrate dehydratase [Vibrio sp. NH-UV-68]|uniref:NAD(P)H-hydrate dehydratase n=1 Tax=unclassified Vibrio TaxID=2614977 RepID=UPI0036F1BB2F